MLNDAAAHAAFEDALNDLRPGWLVQGDGIVGPGGAIVRLVQSHPSMSEGHVDVQLVFEDALNRKVELWDCVVGAGATHHARAQFAAHLWSHTTAGAWLELMYSMRGEFADHYQATDVDGFSGWHSIAGAIIGYGNGASVEALQRWWLENPVLPTLASVMHDALTESNLPSGMKIFFGGDDIAEVRLNGLVHEAASSALASLPWPRLDPVGVVRSYVIVLHRD